MKIYLFFFGALLFLSCHQQTKQNGKVELKSIDELEQKANSLYKDSPNEAITIFKELVELARNSNDHKSAGQANLNIAGIYEKKLNQNDLALNFGYASLSDWIKSDDTLQMANLYKYIGLLEGKLGQFAKADINIEKAIELFESKGYKQGSAVSYINMAEVKLLSGKFEEADQYFLKSKMYWTSVENKSRIFDNNLVGIQLYGTTNQQGKHRLLVEENSRIMKETEIDEFLVNKFRQILNDQVD